MVLQLSLGLKKFVFLLGIFIFLVSVFEFCETSADALVLDWSSKRKKKRKRFVLESEAEEQFCLGLLGCCDKRTVVHCFPEVWFTPISIPITGLQHTLPLPPFTSVFLCVFVWGQQASRRVLSPTPYPPSPPICAFHTSDFRKRR